MFTALEVKLGTGKTLNYEQTTKVYTMTFYISDQRLSTGPYVLTISVQNADEACYFDKTIYYITMDEGAVSLNSVKCFC